MSEESLQEEFDMEQRMEATAARADGTVSSIQELPNPNLDQIEHVEMLAQDIRQGREERNDGLHLVTTHFVLSPRLTSRQKYSWLSRSVLLLFMQMLASISVMMGSFIPNCSANHQCLDGQYC